jgi:hypothetical protein
MFFLTRRESLVMVLIVVALTAGAGIRQCRMIGGLPGSIHQSQRPR